jgi:hypothetical protein
VWGSANWEELPEHNLHTQERESLVVLVYLREVVSPSLASKWMGEVRAGGVVA